MEYIKVKQAANQWGLSERRVRLLCEQGRIAGVIRNGRAYLVPADAIKPGDGRRLKGMIIPEEYSSIFARIDALNDELNRRRPLTLGELHRLREEFMVENTYNSNAIEGNSLTLRETALVLEGITIDQKPLKDHLEVLGHRDAFVYVQQMVADRENITERVIKAIHALVLIDKPDDRGLYRRIPVTIAGAQHMPPQPYLVPVQMENLISEFGKTRLHPIERAAVFHLKFEGVHPFIDGNGRTGRLIMNLQLMQDGYPPINVKFKDRMRYYQCFDSYYQANNALPMVNMIAEYLEEQLLKCLSFIGTDA